ncbi:hypothetical protein C1645_732708 [Glomus cerebriforme]|uniref:Uncharacterized protein n=1 Tax=Glomus cerebriforme TaxID=658196 RepID=A0A397TQG1_9GLOM|nr:hypothetical protein C1645_732708 [Glomus cerebriforme]
MKVIIDITLIEGNKDCIETMDYTIDLETEWKIGRYIELKDSMKAFVNAMLKKQKNGMENKERIEEITIINNMRNSEGNQNSWGESYKIKDEYENNNWNDRSYEELRVLIGFNFEKEVLKDFEEIFLSEKSKNWREHEKVEIPVGIIRYSQKG